MEALDRFVTPQAVLTGLAVWIALAAAYCLALAVLPSRKER